MLGDPWPVQSSQNGGKQLPCVRISAPLHVRPHLDSMSASSSTALKRKRRVYKNGCANPLFVKWVEEWRDDARERGVNSHYSYTKVAHNFCDTQLTVNMFSPSPTGTHLA